MVMLNLFQHLVPLLRRKKQRRWIPKQVRDDSLLVVFKSAKMLHYYEMLKALRQSLDLSSFQI